MTKRRLLSIFVVVLAIALFGIRKFNSGCKCDESPDLTNKVVIITGGNSGIGYETSLGLARRKAHVIIACRDLVQGNQVAKEISQLTGNQKIETMKLDLASLKSVRAFAAEYQKKNLPIHILILNAGLWMGNNRTLTEDGLEMTFGVNHLAHFLLTNLLLPQIKQGKARVVVVSSNLHHSGVLEFDNLQGEKTYASFQGYCNSKLANVAFSNELNRQLEGSGATSISLHPGVIRTQLHRENGPLFDAIYKVLGLFLKNPEEGAQTTLAASVSHKFEGKGGFYLKECDIAPSNPIAEDKEVAKRLWDVSKSLVGSQ